MASNFGGGGVDHAGWRRGGGGRGGRGRGIVNMFVI